VIFFLSTLGTPSRFILGWLAFLGRISYGLYLVHSLILFLTFEKAVPYLRGRFPGLVLSTAVLDHVLTLIVLMLTITVASLSFHYFERPFLRLKKRFTFVAAREEVAPSA
jgi:peptidoglycan/LPS O-acetylase OafA/YrhL